MPLTINQISHYSRNIHSPPMGLRDVLDRRSAREKIQIHVERAPFSIVGHNMGLLEGLLYHASPNREAAKAELVTRLRSEDVDVVCLSEVWDNDEKSEIQKALASIYPHKLEGPDESDIIEKNGGLLLLSKYPFIKKDDSKNMNYRDCAGDDCAANKGALYAQVRPPGSAVSWNIFCTHTQNDEFTVAGGGLYVGGRNLIGSDEDAVKALYAQLTTLGKLVQTKTAEDGFANPTVIVGDFNINAAKSERYSQMISRLGIPPVIDIWAAKRPGEVGLTTGGTRIDYVLLRSGFSFIPVPRQIDVIKWTAGGKPISDHFGLLARFDEGLQITQESAS